MAVARIPLAMRPINTPLGGARLFSAAVAGDLNLVGARNTERAPSTGTSIETTAWMETGDFDLINTASSDLFYATAWPKNIYGSTITAAVLHVSHSWVAWVDDTDSVDINYVDRDGNDLGTTATVSGNTSGQQVTSITLTGLIWEDIGGGAILDGDNDTSVGHMIMRAWTHSNFMAGDDARFRIFATWLEVTYTPTAASDDYPGPIQRGQATMQGGGGRTISFTPGTGVNRTLVVSFGDDAATSPGIPTYDGGNMTLLHEGLDGRDSADVWQHIYYIDIPDADTTSKDIVLPAGSGTVGDYRAYYVVFENVMPGGPFAEFVKTTDSSNTSILLDRSVAAPTGVQDGGLGIAICIGATEHGDNTNPQGLAGSNGTISNVFYNDDAENNINTGDGAATFYTPYLDGGLDADIGVFGYILDDESLSASDQSVAMNSSSAESLWDFYIGWFQMALLDITIDVPLAGPTFEELTTGSSGQDLDVADPTTWLRAEQSITQMMEVATSATVNSKTTNLIAQRNTPQEGASGSHYHLGIEGNWAELRVWAKIGTGNQGASIGPGPAVRVGDHATNGDGYWCYLDDDNTNNRYFWENLKVDGVGISLATIDISALRLNKDSIDGTRIGIRAIENASGHIVLTLYVNRVQVGTVTDTTPSSDQLAARGVGLWSRVYTTSDGELTAANDWQGGDSGLQLTGHAPLINPIDPVIVPTGALTLATFAPTINVGLFLEIPTAALVLTTYAPIAGQGIQANFTLNPEAGWAAIDIASLDTGDPESIAGPNGILNGLLANGDQVHYQTTTETNSTAISLAATGIWTTAETDDTWELRMWDATDSKWDTFVFQTLSEGVLVDVPTAALTLTGLVPSVEIAVVVNVPTAALVLTGQVPTILTPKTVDVPTGSLTLTGQVPIIAHSIAIPTGTLTLTGLVPTILTPRLIDVPTGALTLTGFPLTILTPPIPAHVRNEHSGGTSTVNIDVDSPNGKKRVLLVFVGRENASKSALTGVDVGGQAMTLLGETESATLDFEVWGADETQLSGQSGSRAVTLGGSSTGHGFLAVLFEGVADATVMDLNFFTSDVSGTNFDTQASSLADGLVALCVMGTDNQVTGSYTSPLTERYDAFNQAVDNVTLALASGGEVTETTEKEYDATAGGAHAERVGVVLTFAPQNTIVAQVPTGALTLTGFPPVLPIIIPTAALTLTGLVPSVEIAILVDVPTAALTLTGLVPTILTPRTVDVPTGSLTLAGQVPTILTPVVVKIPFETIDFEDDFNRGDEALEVSPDWTQAQGALAIVSNEVAFVSGSTLYRTNHASNTAQSTCGSVQAYALPVVRAGTGSTDFGYQIHISGATGGDIFDWEVRRDNTVLPQDDINNAIVRNDIVRISVRDVHASLTVIKVYINGSLARTILDTSPLVRASGRTGIRITGGTATLDDFKSITEQSLELTGLPPTVLTPRLVAVPTGALVLTGFEPFIAPNPPTAALVLTGLVPTILTPRTVDVPTAALTLTGLVPTILTPKLVDVPTAAMTLTGLVPTILTPRTVDVPTASLTLTGFAPFIAPNPPTAALVLTGLVPTILTPRTVDVPTASLTLTGQAPEFFHRIQIPTGSLTLTGLAPNVLIGGDELVVVPTATLTLTGLVPTILTPRTVDIPTGSLTLTGLAPTTLTPRLVDVPTGALTLTGLAPEAFVRIQVPTGALTLTGLVPTILTPRTVDVPTGALTLTGFPPSLPVIVPTGTLSLSGQIPTILTPRTVDVPTGVLSLAGLAPTVLTPRTVDIPTGALTLTGLAPSVEIDVLVDVPTAALTLTGLVPSVQIDTLIDVPTAALTLTGLAPSVEIDVVVDVPTGALTLTGLQPFAITPRTVDVPTGSLVLSGLAPDAVINNIVNVPTASMTLTGLAPSVGFSWLQEIPVGSLSITGLVPTIEVSNNIAVDVPTASITLTGHPPTALTPTTVDVPTGTLSLAGLAPAVDISVAPITIPTGALVLTGFAPNPFISADRIINVPTGALVLTGFAPSVESSFVNVPTAAMILQTFAPRVRFARDYGAQLRFKRVFDAAVTGHDRIFVVRSDEPTEAR